MKISIKYSDITQDRLFMRCLNDPRVVSNSVPYIIEEYFNGFLSILFVNKVLLLEDICGNRYKTVTSKNGVFNKLQSCQKGIGRDASMGDWDLFVKENGINYILQVDTSSLYELSVEVVNAIS